VLPGSGRIATTEEIRADPKSQQLELDVKFPADPFAPP
jgi:hypothetical protein